MPIPGLLAGLEEGMAAEVAKTRQAQRTREDNEFTQQLQMLDQLRQDPRTTPELYQKVMQDTLSLQKGLGSQRKPKSGLKGFLGQTETEPYHSNLLEQLSSGDLPLFQDKAAFDTARSGTSADFHQAVGQAISGGAAQPAGAVPPAPVAAPPQGPISGQVNSATPPMQGSPAAKVGSQPAGAAPAAGTATSAGATPTAGGAPSPPPGPVPSPPGTGKMLSAATDLTTQVGQTGPVLPQPPSAADIMARHKASPSAFYNPDEMAQLSASAGSQAAPYQVKSDIDALRAAGLDPRMAALAAARKLTGFTGGMTSGEGPWYRSTSNPNEAPFRSVLQKDNYGNFQHVDPRNGQPIDPSQYQQVDTTANQIITDSSGQLRVVSKLGGQASAPVQDVSGQTKLGKPYTPPPLFQSVQVGVGPGGIPQLMGVPREGGGLVPLQVGGGPARGAGPGGIPAPPQPAVKFEQQKPLSNEQQSALTGTMNIKQSAERALQIIDQMQQQGANMNSPIGQSIDLWLVQHGWNPGELQEELFQNVGYQEVNAMRAAGIGGRPNMKMIEIFQNHVGQPGSSLNLLRTQLQGLEGIADKAAQNILTVAGMYRPLPYQLPGQGNNPAAGGGTQGQGGTVAPPPPKFTDTSGGAAASRKR